MVITGITKTCSKCNIEKEINEFGKNKTKNDGYENYCKTCVKIKSKKYRETNPDKVK